MLILVLIRIDTTANFNPGIKKLLARTLSLELLDVPLEAPGVDALLFAHRGLELGLQVLQAGVVRGHVRRPGLAAHGRALRRVEAEHEGGGSILSHGTASDFYVEPPFQVLVPACKVDAPKTSNARVSKTGRSNA